MKRIISIWFPYWATDRWRRLNKHAGPPKGPLALMAPGPGGPRIAAVDAAAAAEGLYPGQSVADARALVPYLTSHAADPVADAAALGHLADWCNRYTPWSAADGADGLVLDITGCAHLFAGEAAMIADIVRRFHGFGVTARAAAADTPGAAWAWARFGDTPVLDIGAHHEKLLPLPAQALRLPADAVGLLHRLGLRHIADLVDVARAPLARRLGEMVPRRLDRVFGRAAEPISPRRPPALLRARLAFAEEISRREDIDRACDVLLKELCSSLEAQGRGARRLVLDFYRVDGAVQSIEIGTSRPSRDPAHLARLFSEKLGAVEPGFGIETMILGAVASDPLAPAQISLVADNTSDDLSKVVDRLQTRLGRGAVLWLQPVASHIPERAMALTRADASPPRETWPSDRLRPAQLLATPEPIEIFGAPDAPSDFRWRHQAHRIVRREGPERIAPEWWRRSTATRDYYWLEDGTGRRYWAFRTVERAPRWYVHGLFT